MRRLLPFGLAALDAGWLYTWSLLLGDWTAPGRGDPLLPWPVLFAFLLGARSLTRAIRRAPGPPAPRRAGVVLLGLLLVALAIPIRFDLAGEPTGPILLGAFGVGLWWRGLAQARGPVEFETVEDAFRQGAIGLVLFLALGAVTARGLGPIEARAVPSVLVFFVAGLASLAIARLALVRDQSRGREGRPPAVSRQWLGVMLASVGAVVLLGLALDALLSFDLIATAARPLLSVVGTVLFWIVYAVALPIALLADWLIGVLRGRVGQRPPEQLGENPMRALQRLAEGRPPVELSPEAQAAAQILGGAVLVAFVAVALYRTIVWWREESDEDAGDEERDSVWSWREAWNALLMLWQALRGRLRPAAMAPQAAQAVTAAAEQAPPSVLGIREIYRQVLARAAALGAPRPPAATPYEQLPRLAEHLAPPDDLAALTETYVRARYGPTPPDEAAVREALDRIERLYPVPSPSGRGLG